MKTIEEIIDAYDDNESSITDEEYEQLYHYICEKVKREERLDQWEINILWDWNTPVDSELIDEARHGYVYESFVIKIDDSYYSFYAYCHDDYDTEIESQVLVPVELKEVLVKKWVKKEES